MKEALVPETNGSLLRARGFFITLLEAGPTFTLWWGKKPGVAAKRTPGFRFSRGCGVRGL